MLEPDGLDKAARSLQEKYLKEFETAVRLFEDAFADLPKHMKDAFGKTGKEFFQFTDQAGKRIDVLGKTVKEVKANLSALKSKLAVAKELVSATFREAEANDKMTKQMIKQARTAEQLLAAEKMRAELLDESADKFDRLVNQQRALSHMEDAMLTKGKALKITEWANGLGNVVRGFTVGILKGITTGYRELRKAGMDGLQSATSLVTVFNASFRNWQHGIGTMPQDVARAVGGLSNQLGTTNVNKDLAGDAAELAKYYGLTDAASTRMLASMYRYSGYSEKAVMKSEQMVKSLAKVNSMPIGTVLRDMANNTEAMAMYAGRGQGELAKGLIAARKLGVEFKDMSRFAGSMVDDFESSIQMQAELQTVMPGMDFSEMMYSAQFGTDKQFMDATKKAFQGSGIKTLDQLPRSVRDMIVGKTGQSAENIQKLLSGQNTDVADATGKEATDGDRLATTIGDAISNSKLTGAIMDNVAALMANTTAMLAGKGMSSGIGSMLGFGRLAGMSVEGAGIGSKLMAGAGLAGRLGGGMAIGGGLMDIGSSLMDSQKGSTLAAADRHKFLMLGAALGSVVPGLGTLTGAAVGGLVDWGSNSLGFDPFHLQHPQVTGMTTPGAGVDGQQPVPVDTGKVEGLLQELISAVREGKIVHMDGREVGRTVQHSYSRE
jgi:hypothetical protein